MSFSTQSASATAATSGSFSSVMSGSNHANDSSCAKASLSLTVPVHSESIPYWVYVFENEANDDGQSLQTRHVTVVAPQEKVSEGKAASSKTVSSLTASAVSGSATRALSGFSSSASVVRVCPSPPRSSMCRGKFNFKLNVKQ